MIACLLILPFVAAVLVPLLGSNKKKLRGILFRASTMLEAVPAAFMFLFVLRGGKCSLVLPDLCGIRLTFCADGFRALYVLVAAFMWAVTAQFSEEYFSHGENHGRYIWATMLTFGGVIGVFLSDDLYTTFIFFEIMSIASYPWVAHEETKDALRAAATYLGVSIACGMVTLMGMFLLWKEAGALSFDVLRTQSGNPAFVLPACLTLVGYCAKAGLAPLHIWLPKAHPVAPAPASALLSGMLTKTGLFGFIAVAMNLMRENTAFGAVMLTIGLFTMLLGAVLAVFSVNLKRTLACSSLSQIGYIMTGLSSAILLGHHGSLAAAGAVGHMINHSLLKLLLFVAAGAIYMKAHTLDLSLLRGYGHGKKLLHLVFLLGAVGLMGIPGTNGYASKTMIHEALAEVIGMYPEQWFYRGAEYVFLFAAGLTTAYMLKLYLCLFWQRNPDGDLQQKYEALNRSYLSPRSAAALLAAAVPVALFGLFPNQLLLPLTRISAPFLASNTQDDVVFFAWVNLKGSMITLIIGIAVYLFFVRVMLYKKGRGYLNRWPQRLDLETAFYRPVFCSFLPAVGCALAGLLDHLPDYKLFRCWIPNVIVAITRILNEMIDHAILLGREVFLVNRNELKKVRNHSVYTYLASVITESSYKALRFLLPKHRSPHREPTDMRYGSYVTNAISFGLLLCAVGILVAILYVFIQIGA